MAEGKVDLRVLRTRRSIREAFMELIKKKPVSKISVTELASRAMINKGTFYLHYPDIYTLYFDVLKDICVQTYDHIGDFSLFFTDAEEFVRTYYREFEKIDIVGNFPHFSPDELGIQLPMFTFTEMKRRLYQTGRIQESSETNLRLDCILTSLSLTGMRHYHTEPELTIKTIAGIIRGMFPCREG